VPPARIKIASFSRQYYEKRRSVPQIHFLLRGQVKAATGIPNRTKVKFIAFTNNVECLSTAFLKTQQFFGKSLRSAIGFGIMVWHSMPAKH
jgi:hypothetical protein